MSRLIKIAVLLFIAICGVSTVFPAFASIPEGSFVLTPSYGYYRYASKRHVDSQGFGSVSLGYQMAPKGRAEIFYSRLSSSINEDDKPDVHGSLYGLRGLYFFQSKYIVQPYVLGGVGAMYLDRSTHKDPNTNAFLTVGAGLEYVLSKWIALKASVGDNYIPSGGYNDGYVDFGISFYFNPTAGGNSYGTKSAGTDS